MEPARPVVVCGAAALRCVFRPAVPQTVFPLGESVSCSGSVGAVAALQESRGTTDGISSKAVAGLQG